MLDTKMREDLERLKKIRNHRGLRHYWGLRVRGQHTKTTGRRGAYLLAVDAPTPPRLTPSSLRRTDCGCEQEALSVELLDTQLGPLAVVYLSS